MSTRKYKGTALQMLLALRLILENAILVADKIKAVRPKWDDAYFKRLIANINTILQSDFGYDVSAEMKEKTEVVNTKEAAAKMLLQQTKMQIELDFRKDPEKCKRYLKSLGLTISSRIGSATQDDVIKMLIAFRNNITPAIEKELTDAGMNPKTIADLKLLADELYSVNSEQEVVKSNSKTAVASLNDRLDELYDEVITIAKMAASMLTDELDAEKFSYLRAIKQMGYKEREKKTPPPGPKK